MIHSQTFSSFALELEKIAVSPSTVRSYLAQRAAQGVGGAAALGKELAGSSAATSRDLVHGLSGLQKHQLSGVMEGGQLINKMRALPGKVGLGDVAKQTRARVEGAVAQEAANPVSRKGGNMMSSSYEGYMTDKRRAYTPEHIGQVMGISPEAAKVKAKGPTVLMGGSFNSEVPSVVKSKAPPTNFAELTQPTRPTSEPPPAVVERTMPRARLRKAR